MTPELLQHLQELEERLIKKIEAARPVEKIIYDYKTVQYVTGFSKNVIERLIKEKKLTPWQETPGGKLLFYRYQVESLIPASLRN